jgi:hypothetical protein
MNHGLHLARLLAALLALLFSAPARAETPAPASPSPAAAVVAERLSFAVIIGNNKSLGRRRPDLHYADDDAARYFEILQTIAPGRVSLLAEFDRDTGRLFRGAQQVAVAPTRRALHAVGRGLAQRVSAAQRAGHETELYFIFAGHGDVAEGEGFIELADSRFSSSELKQWLGAVPFTRAHVILDSCNSFFMLGVRKPGGRHFATSEDAARALASRLPNVGVFLSTSAEGEAFEWSEIQSGIFSHLVRSGLLGAADANADGSVSYLELAAFVDTATADVRNPNMRPHVFARGPGAADATPIARLQSMSSVRRFALGDGSRLRVRIRDANGLPLLDAHTEKEATLAVVLPEAWTGGAVVERASATPNAQEGPSLPRFYALPEPSDTVTLAALTPVEGESAGRGPDETFQSLFSQPFGPRALASYVVAQAARPPPVYGVSQQDTQRMELVLDQISSSERNRRFVEGTGAMGFGVLIGGAGIGLLHVDPNLSAGDKREARVWGGVLIGLGGLFTIGGAGSLFTPSLGEQAAMDFRRVTRARGDTTQAFALADKRLQELVRQRRNERLAGVIIGSLAAVGSTTGFIWSELAAPEGSSRMGARLGWGGGILAGGLMLGDALWRDDSAESLAKIWRDDPSLNQYQTSLSLSSDGAFFSLSGSL